jgi:hypothetical protein
MKQWMQTRLDEIIFFFESLPFRRKFLSPRKKGFLVEWKEEGKVDYLIQNIEHGEGIIESNKIRNYLIQRMIQDGVPIIPVEVIEDVYAGREKMEAVYERYSHKKSK